MGHVQRARRAKGRTVWEIRYVDEYGRPRTRVAKGCRTRRQAEAELAEEMRRVNRIKRGFEVETIAPPRWTLGELVRWWQTEHGDRLASAPQVSSFLRCHLHSVDEAQTPLVSVRPFHLERVLLRLEKGHAPSSVNRMRRLLHVVFARAKEAGHWHTANPAGELRKRQELASDRVILTIDELATVLGLMSGTNGAITATAGYAGLRKSECLGLRRDCVDLAGRLIVVRWSHDKPRTKSGRERVVPIHDVLLPWLEEALAASKSPTLVFPSPRTGGLYARSWNAERPLRLACKAAGIDKRPRFHDLRHAFATHLLEAGVPDFQVAAMLGHSDTKTTREIYAHARIAHLTAQLARVPFGQQGDDSNVVELRKPA